MPRILILEDDFDTAVSWRTALEDAGHQVETCLSSHEAIVHQNAGDFDVYIVDLLIKGGVEGDSGQVFLRHLSASPDEDKLLARVIGVSGFTPMGSLAPVEVIFGAHRVNKIMIKPFTEEELLENINTVLSPV
jgi:CheY-like chemotaxis protein